MFEVFSLIVAVSAFLSYLNHKTLKLPPTIGVMVLSIVVSMVIGSLQVIKEDWFHLACNLVLQIDFRTLLFDFLLSFLLFAGSIHVNLSNLLKERKPVIIFATFGVVTSTAIIGSVVFFTANWVGIPLTFIECLVFGSLISPTDPVAVLSLLQKANVDKKLEIKIIGESLFNDGVGIVVFLTLLALAGGSGHGDHEEEITTLGVAKNFLVEAGGGILLGIILGYIGVFFLKSIKDEPRIEVHITLGIVMAGYALASFIGVSGALAIVITGIIIGNRLAKDDMPDELKRNLNVFWGTLDEVLNAILFVLIGIEILVLGFEVKYMALSLLAIPIVLIARFISVSLGNAMLSSKHKSERNELVVLTWVGLRGGISIALALTLSENSNREPILFMTYVIVVFSIIVQGLSIESLVKKITNQGSIKEISKPKKIVT
ncbi:MAG: CPA1 family monovalent cation:H+ antiporter [Bacteroidia bacterium]|jgi:CPA1 family monovalent cation:H+ antiporter